MVAASTTIRTFVPVSLEVADWSQLEPLFADLTARDAASPAELKKWLADWSELTSVIDEYGSRRYIEKSCHTDDEAIEKAFLHFVENIDPKTKPITTELQKKFLSSPHRAILTDRRFALLARKWQADIDTFHPDNVALETEVTKINSEYDKTSGAMTVTFRGKEQTLQQLGRYQEETDRTTRQEAWEVAADRRLQDRAVMETQFEQLLPLRQKIARNAGFEDYRAWTWRAYKRFDYTPDECLKFAEAIEQSVVPIVRELDRKRQTDLGVDTLRPWDLSVDPQGRQPLRPFAENDIDGFVTRTKEIFNRMAPELASDFETLRTHGNLDLDSRRGKQPGGYQSSLEESRQPFIFMNAAGMQRDVETLLHEGGHAFHYLWASAAEPLVFLRSAPMEFCEVASMSMEALGADHLDVFYADPALAARARRNYFEGVLRFFPWMATIDLFQHWIYTHPRHTRAQRTEKWLELMSRFGNAVDWTGYEAVREARWQAQLHLYHVPFYYVEYGIAQLGALQIWMKAKEDPRRALQNYRNGLKLGGTRPLPELFEAAGIRFDFSLKTMGPLMNAVRAELTEA